MRRQRARLRSPETEALRRVVPQLPALFGAANSDDDVFAALASVGESVDLAAIELVESGAKQPMHRWESSRIVGDASELVSARYPLGDDRLSRADLRFRWRSATGDVSPQMEKSLLQGSRRHRPFAALLRVASSFVAPAQASLEGATERISQPAQGDLQRTSP